MVEGWGLFGGGRCGGVDVEGGRGEKVLEVFLELKEGGKVGGGSA